MWFQRLREHPRQIEEGYKMDVFYQLGAEKFLTGRTNRKALTPDVPVCAQPRLLYQHHICGTICGTN